MPNTKRPPGESIKAALRRIETKAKEFREKFHKEWGGKFNKHVEAFQAHLAQFRQFVNATGQQLVMLNSNIGVLSNALEHLDMRGQVHGRLLLEMFGRFQQVDVFLRKLGALPEELTPADIEEIKKEAQAQFELSYEKCARWAKEAREAELAMRREEEKNRQAAAQEAQRAEEELKAAEQGILSDPQPVGAEIPAGAEVFGE